jgi:aspartyl-tRNA synthetase
MAGSGLDASALSSYMTLVVGEKEIGGGSIRIHQPDVLRRVLSMIGQEGTNDRIVEALGFGAPPHGGFSLALDTLTMHLLGEDSIRSVVPFPKTASGRCPVFSAAVEEPNPGAG